MPGTPLWSRDRDEIAHALLENRDVAWAVIGLRVGRHLTTIMCEVTAITLPCGYAVDQVLAGLVEACEQLPTHLLRSITFDQGSEWAPWESPAATHEIDCWFCDPHAPWQRDQIENQNRALRWWFPRRTDLGTVTQTDADQRRRNLGYRSPTNLYTALTVHWPLEPAVARPVFRGDVHSNC